MSLLKNLFLGLFRKKSTSVKNVSKVTSQASSIETLKTIGAHDFVKLSREKFTEIKSESKSLSK